jgi:hypothetical protein
VKRRRLLLILLGCVATITLTFLIWPRAREPVYNGVPLTAWLERGNFGTNQVEFTKAIDHIGTNALPILLRAVDCDMPKWPAWKVWLNFKLLPNLPRPISDSRFVKRLVDDKAAFRAGSAAQAFGILGSRANPALDSLRRIAGKRPMSLSESMLLSTPPTYAGQAIANIMWADGYKPARTNN